MVTIDKALEIIYSTRSTRGSHIVPLELAINKISAKKILATVQNPRFNNSAMDGYGIKVDNDNKQIKVIGNIFAGDDDIIEIEKNQAIKITTGARVPQSIEAIVPKEDVVCEDDFIILQKDIKKSSHIRYVGEDIDLDDVVLEEFELITPAKISLLSSQGVSYIEVFNRPKVSIFATGEELKLHFEDILPHQIYNSNAPYLFARVKEMGVDVEFVSLIGDDKESIKDGIRRSLKSDLIITTGGVSVGDKDFVKDSFLELGGEFLFQKIDIKPGKPTVFGKIDSTLFLSLPGNPLAAASIFELFGTALIRSLKSQKNIYHGVIRTKLKDTLSIKPGKATMIPGYFDGENFVALEKRAPGMVNVLPKGNGFILTSKDVSNLKDGMDVNFIPYGFEFCTDKYSNIYTS